MRRIVNILTLLILGAALSPLCAQMQQHILQSRPFSELHISGRVDVECRQSADSAGMIVFSASPQAFDLLKCNNTSDRLNITLASTGTMNLRTNLSKVIVYYSGALSTIALTGSGSLNAITPALKNSVSAMLTGSGKVKISAITTSHLSCSVSGSGNMSIAGETSIKNMTGSVSGSGAIEIAHVNAASISATVNGPGDFIVNGNAEKASFAIKGSGNIDASTLNCTAMTAGAYGSGHIYYSRLVKQFTSSGKAENLIVR